MTIAEAIEEWKKEEGLDKEHGPRETRTVKMSHEDMMFLRALVHPQPSHDEYERIVDGCTISLWESEFDDRFSIGVYESDCMSCVLAYNEGSDYCEVLRLLVRNMQGDVEYYIIWEEVEFIEKKDDGILVTGCRMYETDGEKADLVSYDLHIVERGVSQ